MGRLVLLALILRAFGSISHQLFHLSRLSLLLSCFTFCLWIVGGLLHLFLLLSGWNFDEAAAISHIGCWMVIDMERYKNVNGVADCNEVKSN
jgi:hypothetical protein